MDVERAAAAAPPAPGTANVAPTARDQRRPSPGGCRACQASITQPVNSHTSVPVGPQRGAPPQRRAWSARPGRGTSRSRWATASSVEPASRRRCRAEHREPERAATAARCGVVGERGAGALHQVAERHAARAGRLAAAALHARLHEVHELVVGLGVAPLHGRASRRCARAATAPPRRSPGTSGSAAGTARTRRRPRAPRRRAAGRARPRRPTLRTPSHAA